MNYPNGQYRVAIDTGGTFTDCYAVLPAGEIRHLKIMSNSTLRFEVIHWFSDTECTLIQKENVGGSVLLGFSVLCSDEITITSFFESKIVFSSPLPERPKFLTLTSNEEAPILALRLLTNTGLSDVFPPIELRLGTTKGTNALLENKGAKTLFVVTKGFKDLLKIGDQARPDLFTFQVNRPKPLYDKVLEINEIIAANGEVIENLILPDALPEGIESVAICLKNAYKNPKHEIILAQFFRERYPFVSVSTEISPQIHFLARAETTVTNAYLQPIIQHYLQDIYRQLGASFKVMSSSGGLLGHTHFQAKDSLLSGPAGGIVGAVAIAKKYGFNKIITFDMGGTSTDVARYDGDFEYQSESFIGRSRIQSPTLAIHTVAAGGGSICSFNGHQLLVGPASAGANPGPACYGRGGPLTITDVNLLLGRLDTSQFPIPLDTEAARVRLEELLDSLEIVEGFRPETNKILSGLLEVANETMSEAIRKISASRGYDPSEYVLLAFGGAGGLHACEVANLLNIKQIIVPNEAGLLSAYGIAQAQGENIVTKTMLSIFEDNLLLFFDRITREASQNLNQDGFSGEFITKKFIQLRFKGQTSGITVEYENFHQAKNAFFKSYESTFGYVPIEREIEVEWIRVRASTVAETHMVLPEYLDNQSFQQEDEFLLKREKIPENKQLTGEFLVSDAFSSTFVTGGFSLRKSSDGGLFLRKTETHSNQVNHLSSVELSLFMGRFRTLAEAMGESLRRTSVSTNVKERLDFSCALLDTSGQLVANAPHIPVHLGSLGLCVRKVLEVFNLQPGDAILTNHPGFGGSHLPDLTLISPAYDPTWRLLGFVANRCHHAEIGGIRPGSMPPNAQNLAEEGIVISPFFLMKKGIPQWDYLRKLLTSGQYPTRSIDENIADLSAALASNQQGINTLCEMARVHTPEKVSFFMEEVQTYSTKAIQPLLTDFVDIKVEEFLDDGSLLTCKIIPPNQENPVCTFDFSGTAPVHQGNLNANEAIVQSVVMYVLRCLMNEDVPLNDGLLRNVKIILPENSLLNPIFPNEPENCPAVVGGNVEVSQRLTDLLTKAITKVACSQGTMNNFLFGNESFGYYETIGGGTGAGSYFSGESGVHSNMTNTRITDPEILEWRYPVRLICNEIRENSGGKGTFFGGDGIRRRIRFLTEVSVSFLGQHRVFSPFGQAGGQPGEVGKQWIERENGTIEEVSGNTAVQLFSGDAFVIESPGGGGFGEFQP